MLGETKNPILPPLRSAEHTWSRKSQFLINPRRVQRRTPSARIAACLFLLGLLPTVHAETAPTPPGVRVFVATFDYTDASCHAEALIADALKHDGFEVQQEKLPAGGVEQVLQNPQRVQIVITGSVVKADVLMVTAEIYQQRVDNPRTIEASGNDACTAIAGKIAAYLGSQAVANHLLEYKAREAEAVIARDPKNFDALRTLGLRARSKEDWSSGLNYLKRAEEVRPKDEIVQLNLALCYKGLGNKAQWRAHLDRAQEIDRDSESVGIALGNYYLSEKNYDKAQAYYERWLASRKNGALVRWNLAVLHAESGHPEKAKAVLDQIDRSSSFFEDARAWSLRIEDTLSRRSVLSSDPAKPRASVMSWLKIPEAFCTLLLTFALILLVGPYLSGVDFKVITIPKLSPRRQKALRVIGPLAFLTVLGLFAPLLPLGTSLSEDKGVYEGGTGQP